MVWWIQYEVMASECVLVQEECEKCLTEYLYYAIVRASASEERFYHATNPDAEEKAAVRAEKILRGKLPQALDAIPCPTCGWFQPHMVDELRRRRLRQSRSNRSVLLAAGAFFLLASPFTLLDKNHNGSSVFIAVSLFLVGFLLVSWGTVMGWMARRAASALDPNASPARRRINHGRDEAVTLAEYEVGERPPRPER